MIKPLKPSSPNKQLQPVTFERHTHPLVKFIWGEIFRQKVSLSSVADAAGVDRSTIHKWRKSTKGPTIVQVTDVLTVLGYELNVVKREA